MASSLVSGVEGGSARGAGVVVKGRRNGGRKRCRQDWQTKGASARRDLCAAIVRAVKGEGTQFARSSPSLGGH